MKDIADANTEKYTLDYYKSINPNTDEPPFKYRSNYLADALGEAYRIHAGGGLALGIKGEEQVVFNREELLSALGHIAALERERPGNAPRELAEQVVREMNKEQ